jgi:hypothetical protein
MQFADLKVIAGTPRPVPASTVAAAEGELGFPFPPGYRELMTTLGPGGLFNEVFIYGPAEVVEQTRARPPFADWVRDAAKPHLTVAHSGGEVVPNADLLRFVRLGHTVVAHSLFLHPGRPGVVYAARREFEEAEGQYGGFHIAGEELLEACRYVRSAFTPAVFVPTGRSA